MLDDEYEAWVKQHGENQQTFDPADLPPTAVVGSFTDSRDGQTYRTAIIGYQVWMAQNLNYNTANSLMVMAAKMGMRSPRSKYHGFFSQSNFHPFIWVDMEWCPAVFLCV